LTQSARHPGRSAAESRDPGASAPALGPGSPLRAVRDDDASEHDSPKAKHILALDTCLDACSVAVCDGERSLAVKSEPMARGHQERLAPMVYEVMHAAGIGFDALGRIAVTVGPGSFTGLRVGLAFAKGLALALDIPCAGVGVLEALAQSATLGEEPQGFVCAAVDAKRGQIYLQIFIDGRPAMAPDALDPETAAARLAELWTGGPATLVGSGAALLEGVLPGAVILPRTAPDPLAVARIGQAARAPIPPPRPLYLRAPDARLSAAALAAS
jgi:tRNA threonylcarbamoyladenosine biosynthesis protein TsaB